MTRPDDLPPRFPESRAEDLMVIVRRHFPDLDLKGFLPTLGPKYPNVERAVEDADYGVRHCCSRIATHSMRSKARKRQLTVSFGATQSVAGILKRQLHALHQHNAYAYLKAEAEMNTITISLKQDAAEQLELYPFTLGHLQVLVLGPSADRV